MSNTIPLPESWNLGTESEWYDADQMHAHAAAVSAADNAALRAELLQEHADHKETVEDAMQSVHANATLRERIKVLEDALENITDITAKETIHKIARAALGEFK